MTRISSSSRSVTSRGLFVLGIVFALALFLVAMPSHQAYALVGACPAGCPGSCEETAQTNFRNNEISAHNTLRRLITTEFQNHQSWLIYDFFWGYIYPAMQRMANSLTTVGMEEAAIFGTFLDAKEQLETQRLFQELKAEAHIDYRPSMEMCSFGSIARSLGPSHRNGEFVAIAMAKRSQDRQTGNIDLSASEGMDQDRINRVEQLRRTYCDPDDNNHGFGPLCGGGGAAHRINKDINFFRTVGRPRTLDINFSNPTLSPDEEDILALANNLYAHDVFEMPLASVLAAEDNQDDYIRARSVIAKRSVIENSFDAIVGMKAAGTGASATTGSFARVVLQQLGGFTLPEASFEVGANPSYFSMMELLSQKIYQQPSFYVNLYDSPENVARKDVSMQAIGLMIDRDKYKSELRTEAVLDVLLEMEVSKYQDRIFNRLNWVGNPGKKN